MYLLKAIPATAMLLLGHLFATAQNVGIGTTNPQNTLHVAGGLRVDDLSGTSGIVTKSPAGDLFSLSLTGNTSHALRGDGTFGTLNGKLPSTGIATSKIYNNTALINAGYSLIGEVPTVTSYATTSNTFAANTWQPTYTRGIAANVSALVYTTDAGSPPLATWTGSLMYVWSGSTIYSYNPDTDLWQILNSSAIGAGFVGDMIVWTGSEIFLWKSQSVLGYRYNPATNIVTAVSLTNAPSARLDYSMIWTGTQIIVWGGRSGSTAMNTGAIYNPATNTWSTMSITAAPAARMSHSAVWNSTTGDMIVWGGSTPDLSSEMNTGGIYNVATNTWTSATTTTAAPTARNNHMAAWTGTEMIVTGGLFSGTNINTGGRYNPTTNTWVATSTTGSPAVNRAAIAWTGTVLYVSGGSSSGTGTANLYTYNPATNIWTFIAQFTNGNKFGHHCFYKANQVLIWGGRSASLVPHSNEGFRYFLSSTASSATTISTGPLYLYQKN